MMLRLRELAVLVGLAVATAVAAPMVVLALRAAPAHETAIADPVVRDGVQTTSASPLQIPKVLSPPPAAPTASSKQKVKDDAPFPEWDMKGSGLSARELKPWLESGRVKEIVYYDSETPQVFEPNPTATPAPKDGSTLFVSTKKSVRDFARERAADLGGNRGRYAGVLGAALPGDAYEVVRFDPGWMEDRQARVPRPADLQRSVQGPDYSLEDIPLKERLNPYSKVMSELKSKVVSFGHEGVMVLRVSQGGAIVDGNGADFVIYENPFPYKGMLVQEYAQVGVQEAAGSPVVWFPCDPRNGVRAGCAGVVPVDDGGDLFDLAEVGLQRVQYIVIRDIGYNAFAFKNGYKIESGAEGFDLDAMKLLHAYAQ